MEIQDKIHRKRIELKNNNPLLSTEGTRRWFVIHLFKATLCLALMNLVPPPVNIVTNVLWAGLVCYWLRNFSGYVVQLSHLAAVESNFQDLNSYLGRNGPLMSSPRIVCPNGDHFVSIN